MKITETQRLVIEEATTDDSLFFFRLLNSEGWLRHIGDRNIKSEQDAGTYITDKLTKSYATNGFGLYVMKLKESGEPTGICGFVKRDYLPEADLGFALLPEFEGKGYMTEATLSLIRYGFTNLSFNTILAVTSLTNERSKRLLCRLGFKEEENIQPDANQSPVQLFSLGASHFL